MQSVAINEPTSNNYSQKLLKLKKYYYLYEPGKQIKTYFCRNIFSDIY